MGLLDDIRSRAGELGEKARDGFETARQRASDAVGDVRDRLDGDDTPAGPVPGEADPAAGGSARTAYDEVLDAAEHRAEAVRRNPGPL